jgi:hypothetical protein
MTTRIDDRRRPTTAGDQRGCLLRGLRGGRGLWGAPLDPPLRLATGGSRALAN